MFSQGLTSKVPSVLLIGNVNSSFHFGLLVSPENDDLAMNLSIYNTWTQQFAFSIK